MNSDTASINPHEQRVLNALAASYSADFGFISFATIARRTRLSRPVIRRACRSLTRKGLAKFEKGLWSEDGHPRGSGYAATMQGRERADERVVDRIRRMEWE